MIFGWRLKTSRADGWVHAVSEGVGEKRVSVRDPPVGPRATSPTGPNRSPGPFLFFFFFSLFLFQFSISFISFANLVQIASNQLCKVSKIQNNIPE
jgi:hypothetical protein